MIMNQIIIYKPVFGFALAVILCSCAIPYAECFQRDGVGYVQELPRKPAPCCYTSARQNLKPQSAKGP